MARFNDRQSFNETNNNITITTIKGNALQKTTNRQTHTISKLLSFSVCKGPAIGCSAQVLQNNVIVNLRQQLTLQYDGHKHFRGNFGDELRFSRGGRNGDCEGFVVF